ncbi:RNA polymerase sigma-70 factor (sigma-E family) [Kitasatospora gansuensis]|uniref:RNA polymerase sigma-70 factor (Sigma-E family) n=1 Tax=Kitasatospora gansuensis TaxID=258050 RepID=A0A7W7WG47_9ACTN|nr:SigE family RNA polymerase sigma factor [Kitasatospora gansuensis]MBB4945255.1 RNA polymerase sigma-70 factor (sigma-E family) [Kitasatospora gansuensis]
MRHTTEHDPGPDRPTDFLEFAAGRGPHLVRTAFLLTGGDGHLAEDLAQETLGRMFVKWRTVSRMTNPAGYAQATLVNTFLTYKRRRSSGEHVTDTFSETPVSDTDPALRLTLLRALAQLPPQDRAVLVLRFWEDRSVEETAAVLKLRPGATRTRCGRALERLRSVLGTELAELATK